MPRAKKIDNASLLQMVKDNTPQSELMNKFGLKTSTQLKVAYANALMETGQAPAIKTSRGGKTAKDIDPTVTIGKRGSLVISKKLAQHFGFLVGNSFEVHKSAAGLSLKLKEKPLSISKTGKK